MHNSNKLNEQTITNIIHWHTKLKEHLKQIYYTKFKTSNLIVKNNKNTPKSYLKQIDVVYNFLYFGSVFRTPHTNT